MYRRALIGLAAVGAGVMWWPGQGLAVVPAGAPGIDPTAVPVEVQVDRPFESELAATEAVDRSTAPDGLRWPIKGTVNTPFGGDHDGIDIEAETGDPIVAAAAGRITFAGDDGDGYGLKIVIDHGGGIRTLYSHLNAFAVRSGTVEAGERVGTAGCTGSCTGDHLHFEVHENGRAVNPLERLP